MSIDQAVFLAIIQGLTEFLPLSSSGHLVIFQKIFGFEEPPLLFDILVHVGTLGAILVYFRREIYSLTTKKDLRLLSLLAIGTLPAAIVGVFLEGEVGWIFNSLRLVGLSFLLTALILFSTKLVKETNKKIKDLKPLDALVVGIFQALAILPGVSRSGSTISAGLWRGLGKDSAFDFSILLGILAIFGAFVFKARELASWSFSGLVNGVLGMVIAGIIGYFSLRILENLIKKGKFFWFGFYCLVVGLFTIFL